MRCEPLTLVFMCMVGCTAAKLTNDRFYEYGGEKYRIHNNIERAKQTSDVYAFDFSNNSLNSFPKQLEEFQQLIFLNLRHNQVLSLDDRVCKMTNLKFLAIDWNPIETLPGCVYDMTQLEILTLSGCRIDISKESFAKLANLRILSIGGNSFNEEDVRYLREHLPNCKIILGVD
jgi:Leucine-rich repeat (LRR) protein